MLGRALEIAWSAHEGQKDKGGHPYIRHPLSVAGHLDTKTEIMTALLHDVVEDSDYTIADLEKEGFPTDVLEALKLLTHDPAVDYMDYIRQIGTNALATKVKLADLWHNSLPDRLGHEPTEKDRKRLEKYRRARAILTGEEN